MWLITEGGLSSEYRSHGLHGEKDRLEWLVSETQHFPIYVHLQAAAYKSAWLLTGGGLSAELCFSNRN